MDGFTYTDIFETKGIEYLVIIAFLILLIPYWYYLNKPAASLVRLRAGTGVLRARLLSFPENLLYGRNLTWIRLESKGKARIGLNDLFYHLTGKIEVKVIKTPGESVKKGEILAEISGSGGKLKLLSPLSGEMLKLNPDIQNGKSLHMNDPYKAGWLAAIRPTNWEKETSVFIQAKDAPDWAGRILQTFRDKIVVNLQLNKGGILLPVMQEGGELKNYPLEEMPSESWNLFQDLFMEGKK